MSSEHANKLIHVQYQDKAAVFNCYLSFCKDGGLFVPTDMPAHLGMGVNLLVELPMSKIAHPVSAKVVWLSYSKRKGIGVRVHPDEFGKTLKTEIENLLGGGIAALTPTFTM